MADNRMYIRCDVCSAIMLIAKNFGGWGVRNFEDSGIDFLDDFFAEHDYCENGPDAYDKWSRYGHMSHYSLVYELSAIKSREAEEPHELWHKGKG